MASILVGLCKFIAALNVKVAIVANEFIISSFVPFVFYASFLSFLPFVPFLHE